jgi:hypothetical protein
MGVKKTRAPKSKKPGPKYDLFNQLLLVVIIATVTTFPFIFDSFTISKLFTLAIGLAFISIRLYLYKVPSLDQKIPMGLTVLMCLFLLSIFISWHVSDVPLTRGLIGQFGRGNGVLYYFFVVLIFALSVKSFKASSANRMHELITILSWFMAVYAALQRFGIDIAKLDTKGVSPVVLTFGNSNFAGGMLSVLFAYQLTYMVISRTYRAPQISLLISLLISSTFAAAVQGYLTILFSIFFAITVIIIKKHPVNWVRRSLVVTWGLGLISLVMGAFGKFALARIFDRGSFQIRVEYWKIALEVIKDFPIFGIGPDKLYDLSSNYMAPGTIKIITSTRLDNAHNWFLNFGVSFGLFSVFFLLAICGWVFVASARLLKNFEVSNAVPLSSLVAFAATFLIGLVSLEQPGLGIWFYLFAGVVVGGSLQLSEKGIDKISIKNLVSRPSLFKKRIFALSLSVMLSASTIILGYRVVLDGILRSHVQTAILDKGTTQTFYMIESAAIKLRAEPEYSIQALGPLAAKGDALKVDSISKASYDYSPNSIQASLIRADVLHALSRPREACPITVKLIKSTPWDFHQLDRYIDCYMVGYLDPNLLKMLAIVDQYSSKVDQSTIPSDSNEIGAVRARLTVVAVRARASFLLGQLPQSTDLQSYGNRLLSRLFELQVSNPSLITDSEIIKFKKLLKF